MALLLKLAILPALLALAWADFPIDADFLSDIVDTRNDDDVKYRLPESLDPVHCEIEITPHFDDTADRPAFSFDGIVTIYVIAKEDGINSLILQENVREIGAITVTEENGRLIDLNPSSPVERLTEYQFLKINLRSGVTLSKNGKYTIRIEYVGHMNETPLSRGMFRGSYVGKDGKTHWYAATHLQPTHSRQLFPSFDEPGFKSTFKIIVNRPANFADTHSNMYAESRSEPINGLVKEVFYTTPRMSAYLVTIHISDEFTIIADNGDAKRPYRILARPDAANQGQYALEVGPPLTKWLEEYLGKPYYEMAENMKNDQIASPFWASGATENWGLVTYRELRLLYEEGETNAVDKMSIGTITAHELGHKWFGNLVTARWWDNVWINEGYASYFEYFAMDAVDKSMDLADQFNIMYTQSALATDSSASTRALQHTVNTPTQVSGHFSGISYSKGAALLNMLKHFLGENTFKKSLNYYLDEMKYEYANPDDVFRGFARAVQEDGALTQFTNVNITDFLSDWVYEPGYPVINVDINMNTGNIYIEQERFFTTTGSSNQVWPLPLTYTSASSPDWSNTKASHVMTGKSYNITKTPAHEWTIFNVKQNGYYRVNYDTHNWELIAEALQKDVNAIHYLNRAQIVDDVFALMRSGRMTHALGFQILDFLKKDVSYYSWYPAISGFNWLRNRFLHLPDVLAEFDEILYKYLDAVVTNLGYEAADSNEPLTRTLNRFYVMSFACNIGHEGCVQHATQKYTEMVNGGKVDPNIRRHVYCTGLRQGSLAQWKVLQVLYLASNNQADEVVKLRGLGCTSDEQAVKEYLEMVLTDAVKAQDRVNAFTYLYMGDRGNAQKALQFIKTNHNQIREAVVGSVRFNTVLANLAAYTDEEGLQDMESWLEENKDSIPEYSVGVSAVASARANMAWGTQNADSILKAARGSAAMVLPTALLLIASLFALLMK
uniref:Aminopeptidase n=1 Tax=Plutella xylostella TaxID=51655 RepID=A0A076YIK8_PLUXY|nr:aminopeptidase N [Plutella xylostella]